MPKLTSLGSHRSWGVEHSNAPPEGEAASCCFLTGAIFGPHFVAGQRGAHQKPTLGLLPACPGFLGASVGREQTRHLSPQINQVSLEKVSDDLEVGEGGN